MQFNSVSYLDNGIVVKTDKRGDGFYEIVVKGPIKGVGGAQGVIAIISRQCVGGKWCLYEPQMSGCTGRFNSRKAAMSHALAIAAQWAGHA